MSPALDLAAFGGKLLVVVEPAFDRGGDALAQRIDRARARRLLVPGLEARRVSTGFSSVSTSHSSTSPAWPVLKAWCSMLAPSCQVSPSRGRARVRTRYRPPSRIGSVERKESVSGTSCQARPSAVAFVAEGAARPRRTAPGSAPWKRVDRLLLVADGEQRAQLLACARAGEELRGQAPRRCSIAPGWCPAPRRPGCGRCRRRFCTAPRRRRRRATAAPGS